MDHKLTSMLLATLFVNEAAQAQQSKPDAMVVAQAADRCMTTYAVRLTKTFATDEEIYREASEGCSSVNGLLLEAVKEQLPAQQAQQAVQQLKAQSRPNFLALLTRIRSDRARRDAQGPVSSRSR